MNGGSRLILSNALGVMLALGLITGLASLSSLSQTSVVLQADTPIEDEAPKMEGATGDRALDFEASPSEEQAITIQEQENDTTMFATLDPVMVGTPFTVALIVSLAAFMMVRNKIE